MKCSFNTLYLTIQKNCCERTCLKILKIFKNQIKNENLKKDLENFKQISYFEKGMCKIPSINSAKKALHVWLQTNIKKWALDKMPCDDKDNCHSWHQKRICRKSL